MIAQTVGVLLLPWFFCVWIFCAVAAQSAAEEKGRSGFAWLVAGLLFGVLALVAIAAFPPKRFIERGPSMLCPRCRSYVPWRASACRYCQASLVPEHVGS